MLLLSVHTRYETWKPGRYQTKAQLADREPQVSFERFFWISTISKSPECGGEGIQIPHFEQSLGCYPTVTIPLVIRFNDARLIDPTGSFKKNPAFRVDPSGQWQDHTQGLRTTAPVKSDVANKRVDVLYAMLCSSSYTERSHTKPSFLSLSWSSYFYPAATG